MCSPFIHWSFCASNDAGRLLDAGEIELGDHLVAFEHLAVVAR